MPIVFWTVRIASLDPISPSCVGSARQVIESAEAHRLDRVRRGGVRRQHGDWRWMRKLPDAPQRLQPVHPRHAEIEQHAIDRFVTEHGEGRRSRRRYARLVP
jgi:hypothetical protein